MKSKVYAIIAVAVILIAAVATYSIVFAGDSSDKNDNPGEEVPSEEAFSIVDYRGNTISFDAPAERIVSLGSAFTDVISWLNCEDKIVGLDGTSYKNLENAKELNIVDLGAVSSINLESLKTINPDCIFIWSFPSYVATDGIITNLENNGFKVVALYPSSVDSTMQSISTISKIIGSDEAIEKSADLQNRIDAISAKVANIPEDERVKVYLQLQSGNTVGKDSISNELITLAGGINIYGEVTTSKNPTPNAEYIATQNPDVILLEAGSAQTETVDSISAKLPTTNAVQDGRVHIISANTMTASPNLIIALEEMVSFFYPDL
ncbi:hypothetical protein A3206_05790 [Candidatus Methanomassiliicoccus intestinalis]|uniref:Iron(III) ABC transporter, periplasmic-binding protein n=1 Tax=Methanomassiliicoccus intestinalis (strain Issoire-Mx1) TaxID=1295009 RepID=R9T7E9_METII|nr:ABC transporter substrate-binding protein [Candidatus Methanomassiliicoccus intestinalis]AGN26630.1 Iron(III) ABC transporter, periplasmic-binding protein [Candidatus Methanomassiliicoccus intestinalis Issoire-Mx1]TQS83565.1 MAG: hypothetical protein A3206_05790 [Candidatus Methanomassiliicoccus intestinalis]